MEPKMTEPQIRHFFLDDHRQEYDAAFVIGAVVRSRLATDQSRYDLYLESPDEYLGKAVAETDKFSLEGTPPRFFSAPKASV